ncbi:MAG TPA: AAA family ATPase [Candidatus Saccharimonadales bacterium]
MIYLVGGPPRVGKTTLVKYLVQMHPMHAVSTDAIRYMLRRSVPKEALNQDIFIDFHEDVMGRWNVRSPQQTLDEQNRQSKAYWPALEKLIEAYTEDGVDVVVEGVAILPEFAKLLRDPSRSVFLGNTAESHGEAIRRQAGTNPHDWMHNYGEEELENAAEFFMVMSHFIISEAGRYGFPYVEMVDDDFDGCLRSAAAALLK